MQEHHLPAGPVGTLCRGARPAPGKLLSRGIATALAFVAVGCGAAAPSGETVAGGELHRRSQEPGRPLVNGARLRSAAAPLPGMPAGGDPAPLRPAPAVPAPPPADAPAIPPAAPLIELQTGFEKIAARVGPSVVSISARKPAAGATPGFLDRLPDEEFEQLFGRRRGEGEAPGRERFAVSAGSGVIVDPDGLVLTNLHVIEGAVGIEVATSDRRKRAARVVGVDGRSDLAVLKIDLKGLQAAKLGNADDLRAGHWVVAVGNPFGIAGDGRTCVSVGVVSGLGRRLGRQIGGDDRWYGNLIQTDASINPGNSGGPLVNVWGEVVGINTVISTRSGGSEGVGFAVPVNAESRAVIAALCQGREPDYGWLGAAVDMPDEAAAAAAGVPYGKGALVTMVDAGAPAEGAGLRVGDVVLRYGDVVVEDGDHLVRLVGGTAPGTEVTLFLMRGKADVRPVVKIGRRKMSRPGGLAPDVHEWRGIAVRELTPADKARLGLPGAATGVLVDRVRPDSPATRAAPVDGGRMRIAADDLIVRIGAADVRNLADFQRVIGSAAGRVFVGVAGKADFVLDP